MKAINFHPDCKDMGGPGVGQSEFVPLPVLRHDLRYERADPPHKITASTAFVSAWRLSWLEVLRLVFAGRLVYLVAVGLQPPVILSVKVDEIIGDRLAKESASVQ